jgi:hypothetical protein
MKTVEDYQAWEAYRLFKLQNRRRDTAIRDGVDVPGGARNSTGRRNLTKGGYVGVAKRAFLAAYQRRVWGLEGADLSQVKLAQWLTEQGYSTSASAVKNGTTDVVQEYVVPNTPEVIAFLGTLKKGFPGLEIDRFLIKGA